MDKSIWNGYTVHGDVKELENIVENPHMISLDRQDILLTFSKTGDNWISVAVAETISEAFNEAMAKLPIDKSEIKRLLIDFQCGINPPTMAEIGAIPAAISELSADVDVKWGISKNEEAEKLYKIVLVASS